MPYRHQQSWPRPPGTDQIACHCCDALQAAPQIVEGEAAYCGLCGNLLYQNRPNSLSRAAAWSFSALVLMVLVHSFPFLNMESAGIHTKLTLVESARTLVNDGEHALAVALMFFTVFAPFAIASTLLYVTVPLHHGRAFPGAMKLTRWMEFFLPWSMPEVFLLGFIVSLLKLAHLAHLSYGAGLWALCGLVICLAAALAGIDRRELWDRLEVASQSQS